ncbi:TonB-dependent receptor [Flavobacterium sp.]|uniref:TonB-dependent receptor n=1 Tax=Flavobacterium sp. TaxID=239 RepID=UPI002602F2BC|nr:TonB-dependent receptor [Flavobacterium sp.]
MKTFFTIFIVLLSTLGFSQTKISGKVVDEKNNPIIGANIYIEGTYDGATSNEQGEFQFETTEKGNKNLIITFLSFNDLTTPIDIEKYQYNVFKLKPNANLLDEVVINAGTFEAGEKGKNTVLKPLDIVTTAGSNGDIVSALQTLPGTQTVGESGRLFVRGGEADETQTYVDGIRVAQPFGSTTQNLPTRGRFSPFLFSGISFSTGGYSAEYGEALSSVLLLNTTDVATENKTDISLMTVGLGLANTQKWEKSSLTFNTAYIDLSPYQVAVPQNIDWNRAFQSLSGEIVYRYQLERGLFKLYSAYDASRFDLNQESINSVAKTRVNLKNNNLYVNASYKGNFGSNWQITTGLSYGYGTNSIDLDSDNISNNEHATHLKLKIRKPIADNIKLSFGADYFRTQFDEKYTFISNTTGYNSNLLAAFTEADIVFSRKLALKIGVRASNNDLLKETSISPRTSLAYKISKASQFSMAYGQFDQAPRQDYLKFSTDFRNESASHYIVNYQYSKDKRTFRSEIYYKDYSNLVKFDTPMAQYNSNFNSSGFGFAKGVDVFWRDNKSVKNLEYWISYSYIDTKRDYKNFEAEVTPNFVAKNNFSIVTKYWIDDWKSSVGVSYSFNSGRPFDNPNEMSFMNGKTKSYNNLSMSWAYLLSPQKILFFSISNVLGTQNVFGYEYANTPNAAGIYNRREITPTADRFFFVGFFWTISDNKKTNQLDNL